MVEKTRVVFGGWYQRTTLHLSEVQRFLLHGTSELELSNIKLKDYREGLRLQSVKRVVKELEYLEWETEDQIMVRYYEDGLYTISKKGTNIDGIKKEITEYFKKCFRPAIRYLFSLGAPTPKILSNMKDDHPFLIERNVKNPARTKIDESLGEVYKEAKSNNIRVSKTPENIIIDFTNSQKRYIESLSEMQIFFSEFKLQLHKYLDIHRKVWEDIEDIKEKEFLKGKDISKNKSLLDGYEKTIQLIRNRINQMSNYAKTRRDISTRISIDRKLVDLFQYRFEDLFNTLEYIKEVWAMTLDYVKSAIRVMEDIEQKVGAKGIKSIQFLVGFGVVAGIVRYLGPQGFPEIAASGVLYVTGLGLIAAVINKIMKWQGKKKMYKVKFKERDEDI